MRGGVRAAVDAVDDDGALDAAGVVGGKGLADVAPALESGLVGLVPVVQLLDLDVHAAALEDEPVRLGLHGRDLVGTHGARDLHVGGRGPRGEGP